MTEPLPKINCAGCRTCCVGDTIALRPGDNPAKYKTVPGPGGSRLLAKGKDGNCVYLGKGGCQIYRRQPLACRIFDCRKYYQLVARDPRVLAARRDDPLRGPVLAEGERRLALLATRATSSPC